MFSVERCGGTFVSAVKGSVAVMSTEVDFVASLESRGNEHNGSRLLKLGTRFYFLAVTC